MSTAVILMTHRFDAPILEEFQRIREGLSGTDRAFVLSDGSAPTPDALIPWTHTFDAAQVCRRASRIIGTDILRNVQLAWIDFFEAHPGFEAYWLIEYDVLYSGDWNELFDAFRNHPYDLLCTHLRTFAEEPQWYWWHEIQAPGQVLPTQALLRGFLPIARLSRRGFERLRDAVDEGWAGFLEGLIPTLFQASGLSIADLGGEGSFVPEGFQNRFYTSTSDSAGSLHDLGTMRFTPPIPFPRIRAGRLYHPVKPGPGVLDALAFQPRQACMALDCALKCAHESPNPARHLQLLTGLTPPELGAALDLMETEGGKALPLQDLRHRLLTLEPKGFNRLARFLRRLLLRQTPS